MFHPAVEASLSYPIRCFECDCWTEKPAHRVFKLLSVLQMPPGHARRWVACTTHTLQHATSIFSAATTSQMSGYVLILLYSTLTPQPVSHSHQTLCVLRVPVHFTPRLVVPAPHKVWFVPWVFWLLRVRSVLHFTVFFAMIQSSLWLKRSVSV